MLQSPPNVRRSLTRRLICDEAGVYRRRSCVRQTLRRSESLRRAGRRYPAIRYRTSPKERPHGDRGPPKESPDNEPNRPGNRHHRNFHRLPPGARIAEFRDENSDVVEADEAKS